MTLTAKVLAVRNLKFTDKDDKTVEGYQVWLSADCDERGWNGTEILKVWVNVDSNDAGNAAALLNGDSILVEFNRYGKPVITNFAPVLV